MPGFDAGTVEGRLILDRSQFTRELREAEAEAEAFEKKKRVAKITLVLDTKQAKKDLKKFQELIADDKKSKIVLGLDTKKAKEDFATFTQSLSKDQKFKIKPNLDADDFLAQLERITRDQRIDIQARVDGLNDLNNLQGGDIRFNASLDTGALMTEIAALEALRPDITFNADLDTGALLGQLGALSGMNGGRIKVGVDIDTDAATSQFRWWLRAMNADAKIKVKVDIDPASVAALRGLLGGLGGNNSVDNSINTINNSIRNFNLNIDRSNTSVLALGASLAKLASIPTMTVLAGAAAGLVGQLAQVAGILPVMVAGFVGLGTAAATVKMAISGVGDAIKATDAESLNKAMKELTPSAQQFVLAVRDMKDEWKGVQQAAQQSFFQDLGPKFTEMSQRIIPGLTTGFKIMGTALNGVAKDVMSFAQSQPLMENWQTIVQNTASSFDSLGPIINNVAGAIMDLAAEGSSFFPEFAQGAEQATARFRDFIAAARESGQLREWIQNAIDVINQLADIVGNLGGIFSAAWGAIQRAGLDVLQVIQDLTQEIETFFKSAEGAKDLETIFRGVKEFIDNALPGIKNLGTAIWDIIVRLGAQLPAIGEGIGKMAQGFADFLGFIAPITAALGPLFELLGNMGVLLPIIVAGFLLWAPVAAMVTGITTAFLTLRAALTGIATLLGANALFAGILGTAGAVVVAVAGVIAIIAGLVGAQRDAAAAARDHQAAVDSLASSLEDYTGAITHATEAQRAQDVITKTLHDGTTKLSSVLGKAGIQTDLFVQATLGNQTAISQVTQKMDEYGAALINNDPRMKNAAQSFLNMGLSMQDIVAAASGNADAMNKVNAAIDTASKGNGKAAASFKNMFSIISQGFGDLNQVRAMLVDYAGVTGDATKQVQDLALASGAFGEELEKVTPKMEGMNAAFKAANGNWDPMAVGAKDAMTQLDGVAAAAIGSAQAAGRLEGGFNGAAAGAASVGKYMEEARGKFIAMATNAGLSAEAANRLADSLGLIPSVAETNFKTNATETQAQINNVRAAFDAVPGSKTVVIKDLSDEARKNLEEMGFKIENLPDGTFKITPETDEAFAKLGAFEQAVNGLVAIAQIDADASKGTQKGNDLKAAIDNLKAVMKMDGDIGPGTKKGNDLKAAVEALVAIMQMDGDNQPGTKKGDDLKAYVDALIGTILLEANDQATPVIDAIPRQITVIVDIVTRGNAQIAPTPIMRARGGLVSAMADGGMVTNAVGHIRGRGLSPMSNSIASIVPPNTWRVIGDRIKDDEFFIPDNNSKRSLSIGAEWLRRRGMSKLPEIMKMLFSGSHGSTGAASGDNARPAGVQSWGWQNPNTDTVPRNTVPDDVWRRIQHAWNSKSDVDQKKIIDAITAALNSRGVEHLTVQTPQGASVKEVVDEAIYQIRHARKGVYRKK